MDHHTVAAISVTGACLDVLGSLYLAYDLLGGQHGPLRLLTRAVTYALVFGIGYGLGLGLFFGLAAGTVTGLTLSIALTRAARGLGHYSLPWEGLFSAIRGFGLAVGLFPGCGLCIRARFCLSHHARPDIRLLSRHAPRPRLHRFPPSPPQPSSVSGNGDPHSRLHCLRSPLQFPRSSR